MPCLHRTPLPCEIQIPVNEMHTTAVTVARRHQLISLFSFRRRSRITFATLIPHSHSVDAHPGSSISGVYLICDCKLCQKKMKLNLYTWGLKDSISGFSFSHYMMRKRNLKYISLPYRYRWYPWHLYMDGYSWNEIIPLSWNKSKNSFILLFAILKDTNVIKESLFPGAYANQINRQYLFMYRSSYQMLVVYLCRTI